MLGLIRVDCLNEVIKVKESLGMIPDLNFRPQHGNILTHMYIHTYLPHTCEIEKRKISEIMVLKR